MSQLQVLVVDDHFKWRNIVRRKVRLWHQEAEVCPCANFETAKEALRAGSEFALAVVDLGLDGKDVTLADVELEGLKLLRLIRDNPRSGNAGLIVLTGRNASDTTRQALKDLGADDYILKDHFSRLFPAALESAFYKSRLRAATELANRSYRLAFRFNDNGWVGSELSRGSANPAVKNPQGPPALDFDGLLRRDKKLSRLIAKGAAESWRKEASSVGRMVYQELERRGLLDHLTATRASQPEEVWLEFSGTAGGLSIPFELIRDHDANSRDPYAGGESLCLHHPLTRRHETERGSRKTASFQSFLKWLKSKQQPLRSLIVGVNSDGNLREAEIEPGLVEQIIAAEARRFGLATEFETLIGSDAVRGRVEEELKTKNYHLFHFAGHGHHDARHPDNSKLVLKDGTITARQLKRWVEGSPLHLIYLSSCLLGRAELKAGAGDFRGTIEAMAKADVPIVLGYRWPVRDEAALEVAKVFYQSLWRTLSPAHALLEARRHAEDKFDLFDHTWAAPVMLLQSS